MAVIPDWSDLPEILKAWVDDHVRRDDKAAGGFDEWYWSTEDVEDSPFTQEHNLRMATSASLAQEVAALRASGLSEKADQIESRFVKLLEMANQLQFEENNATTVLWDAVDFVTSLISDIQQYRVLAKVARVNPEQPIHEEVYRDFQGCFYFAWCGEDGDELDIDRDPVFFKDEDCDPEDIASYMAKRIEAEGLVEQLGDQLPGWQGVIYYCGSDHLNMSAAEKLICCERIKAIENKVNKSVDNDITLIENLYSLACYTWCHISGSGKTYLREWPVEEGDGNHSQSASAIGGYIYYDVGQGTGDPPTDPYGWLMYCDDFKLCQRVVEALEADPLFNQQGAISAWSVSQLGDHRMNADQQIAFWAHELENGDTQDGGLALEHERAKHVAEILTGEVLPSNDDTTTPSHSPDFTSVNWSGTQYNFAKGNQAQTIQILWEAWQQGGHGLSQETIGEAIGSSADRFEIRKTFRQRKSGGGYEQHPAWGSMIQPAGKGCYRLVPPETS